jgi:hypothetical protein
MTGHAISAQLIQELREIVKEELGQELTFEEAQDIGQRFLEYGRLLMRVMPGVKDDR